MNILCSSSLGLLLKYNEHKGGNAILVLAGNYLTAALVGLGMIILSDSFVFSYQSLLFGFFVGAFFVYSFYVFTRAIKAAGVALAGVSSRLSVVIPFALSIIIFNEIPKFDHIIGFGFAIVTIILFYYSLRGINATEVQIKDFKYLFILLVTIGIGDFCMKIFSMWRPPAEKPLYLFFVFFSAFLYTATIVLFKKIKLEKRTVTTGLIMGVPNIFSSFFLLGALAELPAILVYPIANIGIILLTTIVAVSFWKETLNLYGKLAIISGIVAIVLLGM